MTTRIRPSQLHITILIVLLVTLGMLSTTVPYLASPNDRVFAGFHGYSADYVQYVSYIKEGMYGRYHMYFRSFPPAQPATPIHWEYTFFGIVFGILGLNAPVTYHVVRIIFGSLLVYSVYRIFLLLFARYQLALISTLVAFTASCVGWISHSGGVWQAHLLNYFPFFISTPQRVTDRPHYLLGSVLFLLIFHTILRHKTNPMIFIIFFLTSFAIVMVHISSGIVLTALAITIMGLSMLLPKTKNQNKKDVFVGASILMGCLTAALVTNHYVQIYSRISDIFIDKFTYATTLSLQVIFLEIVSFGPILWLGLPGLIHSAFYNHSMGLRDRILMLAWGVIHILLFFVLYPLFRVDQVRFVQSLYFIPLTYGTIWIFIALSQKFGKILVPICVSVLLLATLPTYGIHIYRDLYDMTDYRTFAPFGFPTQNQYAAYQFLDLHSPRESTILANYDAANMLLMYSHNKVIGNDQGWSPTDGQTMLSEVSTWFSGTNSILTAHEYLKKHNIDYIYYGYKERNLGDITHYPFLEVVYTNPEVKIYKVKK